MRRALIDSRFHQDEESARNCCYNSSNFTRENTSDELHYLDEDPHSADTQNTSQSNKKPRKKQAPARPEIKEPAINSEDEQQNSLDASWCLDRSDGTNRSLNQTEVEEKRPTAPDQIYPPLPFNPYFGHSPPPFPVNTPPSFDHSPPPFPVNTPPSWKDTPTLGEIMEMERQEELEAAGYNHKL